MKLNTESKRDGSTIILLMGILALGIILRLGLAVVNLNSNDNHLLVSQKMLEERSLLSWEDCGSCYHPKLFHASAASLIGVFDLQEERFQVLTGQLLNAFVGILLMILIWKFLNRWSFRKYTRLTVFALISLNPKMIGINSQFTNDTFVFFFSALAILLLLQYIVDGKKSMGYLLIPVAVLAMLSKGSGLVIAFVCGLVMLWDVAISREKKKLIPIALLLLVSVGIVPFAGNYYQNYKDSTEVLGLNGLRSPAPHLWKESYVDRPGVTSIVNSYFTFRLIDLVKNPYIWNGYEIKAKNRTSVWSQVYGRTVFAHFDQWPHAWSATDRLTLNIGRTLIILGLIPLFIFLRGFLMTIGDSICRWRDSSLKGLSTFEPALILLFFMAIIGMFLKLTFEHRDFCTMKAIYLWPAIPAFTFILARGIEGIKFRRAIYPIIFIFIGIQVLESILLIDQLAQGNFGIEIIPGIRLGNS